MPQPTNEYSIADREYMAEAIRLANKGRYTTSPNPRVGCVLVNNDKIVGRGFHLIAGDGHAEVNAINDAGVDAKGATAYVSLEPCSFTGRTGACVDALENVGIKRVVSAMEDPNPKVAGQGHSRLLAQGIRVDVGLLSAEASAINPGYIRRMQSGRPWLRCKMAMSVDGRTAMASGESQWITGAAARQRVQDMRAQSCALLTGIGTVLQDDPQLNIRAEQWGQPVLRQPDVVVVDSTLRLPVNARILQDSGEDKRLARSCLVACLSDAEAARQSELKRLGADLLLLPSDADSARELALSKPPSAASDTAARLSHSLNLDALINQLGAREYNEVMVEAGPTLAGALLAMGLLDQLDIFVAGKLMGSDAQPLFTLPLEQMSEAKGLTISQISAIGDDWLMTCVLDNNDTSD